MKKSKYLLSVVLVVIFIFSSAAPAAALDADKFEARQVTAYLFSMEKTATVTCLFDRDLPEVPYIDIADYQSFIYSDPYLFQKNEDGTTTISGIAGNMIVDAEKDTVTIEHYELFLYGGIDDYEEYLANKDNNRVFEKNYEDTLPDSYENVDHLLSFRGYTEDPAPLFLDLSAYGIDIIEINDCLYFPVSVLNDIMSYMPVAAVYLDGCLYFKLTNDIDDYFSRESFYNRLERSEAVAEFTYNELCFQFDYFYGCPSSAALSKSIEEIGFDKTLDTYSDETRLAKELLLSTSTVDFNAGLHILALPLDDNGHTITTHNISSDAGCYHDSALMQIWFDNYYSSYEPKWVYAFNSAEIVLNKYPILGYNIRNARNECLADCEPVLKWDYLAELYICGDTAIFSFDNFFNDVIGPFVWSLDYAKELGIKNFVLDVTLNGGGVVDVYAFMLAMMINKNTKKALSYENHIYRNTNNIVKSMHLADLNLDGRWDELDREVIYDFDFAILTSAYSASSAYLLAALAKQNGIMVLGDRSGGGSCQIGRFYTPTGEAIRISSIVKSVWENGEDTENGAEVDVDLSKPYTGRYMPEEYQSFGTEDIIPRLRDNDGLYDYASLGKYINEFYDKGDVNGDGVKNNKDVIDLFNYVSEDNGYAAKYDINSNGKINNRDVFALFKKVSEA